jgi:isocitrate dehydrogenase (NAD+)
MVEEGRAEYADPSSIIKAAAMLLNHIGFTQKSARLEMALDICCQFERKLVVTGRSSGATGEQFAQYLMATLGDKDLDGRWKAYRASD